MGTEKFGDFLQKSHLGKGMRGARGHYGGKSQEVRKSQATDRSMSIPLTLSNLESRDGTH